MVRRISIRAGKIVFEYDANPQTDAFILPDAEPRIDRESTQSGRILVWGPSEGLAVKVSRSEDVHLSKPRSAVIKVMSGWNDISASTVIFRAASAGLRLYTAQAKVQGAPFSLMNDSQPGTISFAQIPPGSQLEILIPYSLEVDLTAIAIRVEVIYSTQKGQFTYVTRPSVQISLPLAVSVQDIFKKDALFSFFTIRSATSLPIQIDRIELKDNDDFAIITPPSSEAKVDVFSDQSFSLVAEICRKADSLKQNGERHINNKVHLVIKYRCLEQILFATIKAQLMKALATAQMQQYSSLVSQHLEDRLPKSLLRHDLETFGLLKEVNLGSFERFGWGKLLPALPPNDASQVLEILQHSDLVSMCLV